MRRRLLKFKYKLKDGQVLVRYEQDGKNDVIDTITLETTDPPRIELISALQAMAEHLIEIIEAPRDWRLDTAISSVTVTWTNEVQGLVITGLRKLNGSNSPMVINTPHFTRESYNSESDSNMNIFSSRCGADLDALCDLVFKYVDGERKQLTLDFEEEKSRFDVLKPEAVML